MYHHLTVGATRTIPHNIMTKEEVLQILECMSGCDTPAYSCDCQGYNESYNDYHVDDFFNEDYSEYLPGDDWELVGFEKASPEDIDMDVWAQEFPKEDIEMFKEILNAGRLSVATFHNDSVGTLKIIISE